MTAPAPTVPTGHVTVKPTVTVPSKGMLNGIVLFGCLVMMGFVAYLMWKGEQRAVKSDAGFRDAVHTLKERASANGRVQTPGRSEYSSPTCSVECGEGHTYKPGCVQYVKPESSDAETL